MSDHYAFVVQIHDLNGRTYQGYFDPEYEEDVDDDIAPDLLCTPEDIFKVSSVQDLLELLNKAAYGYGMASFANFAKEIKKISSIDEISSIVIKRIYEAYKEAADPWLTILDELREGCIYVPNEGKNRFYNYILQYRKADDVEKKRVCAEFKQFMEHAEGFKIDTCYYGEWPTSFMGTVPMVSIDWRGVSNDFENAVRRISDMQFYVFQTYCVDTVTIDMKNKNVSSKAQFIFQNI